MLTTWNAEEEPGVLRPFRNDCSRWEFPRLASSQKTDFPGSLHHKFGHLYNDPRKHHQIVAFTGTWTDLLEDLTRVIMALCCYGYDILMTTSLLVPRWGNSPVKISIKTWEMLLGPEEIFSRPISSLLYLETTDNSTRFHRKRLGRLNQKKNKGLHEVHNPTHKLGWVCQFDLVTENSFWEWKTMTTGTRMFMVAFFI